MGKIPVSRQVSKPVCIYFVYNRSIAILIFAVATEEMFATAPSQVPRVLRTANHVTDVVGEAPVRELCTEPSWIVFRSNDDFKTDSFAEFTITNEEHYTMAYRLRTKVQLFRIFPQSCGILRPFEKKTFKIYVTTDGWDRSLSEVVNHTLKILVENIRIPEIIRPMDDVVFLALEKSKIRQFLGRR